MHISSLFYIIYLFWVVQGLSCCACHFLHWGECYCFSLPCAGLSLQWLLLLGSVGFPGSSVGKAGKESACNAGDPGSIPGSGRSPGEGIGYPLQYSWASLMAQLVKNLSTMQETWVSLGWKNTWRRERLPTPVFWPGEFHGLCSPRGRKESDTAERPSFCVILQYLSFSV